MGFLPRFLRKTFVDYTIFTFQKNRERIWNYKLSKLNHLRKEVQCPKAGKHMFKVKGNIKYSQSLTTSGNFCCFS
jgi:hypothetical protein